MFSQGGLQALKRGGSPICFIPTFTPRTFSCSVISAIEAVVHAPPCQTEIPLPCWLLSCLMTSSHTLSPPSGAIFTHHPHPPHLLLTVSPCLLSFTSCGGCIVANNIPSCLASRVP